MPDFATSSRHWMGWSAAHGDTQSFWSSPNKILEHLTHLAFDRRTGNLAQRTCFVSVIQNKKRPCAPLHHPRLTGIQYILTYGKTYSMSCAKVNRSGFCLLSTVTHICSSPEDASPASFAMNIFRTTVRRRGNRPAGGTCLSLSHGATRQRAAHALTWLKRPPPPLLQDDRDRRRLGR